jgi:hypothetical protein
LIFDNKENILVNDNGYKLKGVYTFNNIWLGNTLILNCCYQSDEITYVFESTDDIFTEYQDATLLDLKEKVEYYKEILDGTNESVQ